MAIARLVCGAVTLLVVSAGGVGSALAQETIRVVSPEASVRLNMEESSAVVAVVKIGTVLEVRSQNASWYGVVLPPDSTGVPRFGYISANDVERFVSAAVADRAAQSLSVNPGPASTTPIRTLAALDGRVKEGTTLIVYDALQHQRRVTFRGATEHALQVTKPSDKDWRPVWATGSRPETFEGDEIPADQILRIEEERRDGLGRGIGIGFAVGGGLTLLAAGSCPQVSDCRVGSVFAKGMLILALPAMAIGAAIDASIKERVTIYEAPGSTSRISVGPLIAGHVVGAQLVWGF